MWLAVGRGGDGNQTQIQTFSLSLFQSMLRAGLHKTTSKKTENTELFCFSSHCLLKWQTLGFKRSLGSYWPVHYHGKQRCPDWSTCTKPSPATGCSLLMDGAKCGWESDSCCCGLSIPPQKTKISDSQQIYSISPACNSLKRHENRHMMCLLQIFSFKFLCCFWNVTRLELPFDREEPNVTS